MCWENIGYIKASKIRHNVFFTISKGPKTPKELQKEIDSHFSQISLAIKELRKRDLISCLTNDLKKGKIYTLSEKGKELAPILKNLES